LRCISCEGSEGRSCLLEVEFLFDAAQTRIHDFFDASQALLKELVHRVETPVHVRSKIGDPDIDVVVAEEHT